MGCWVLRGLSVPFSRSCHALFFLVSIHAIHGFLFFFLVPDYPSVLIIVPMRFMLPFSTTFYSVPSSIFLLPLLVLCSWFLPLPFGTVISPAFLLAYLSRIRPTSATIPTPLTPICCYLF